MLLSQESSSCCRGKEFLRPEQQKSLMPTQQEQRRSTLTGGCFETVSIAHFISMFWFFFSRCLARFGTKEKRKRKKMTTKFEYVINEPGQLEITQSGIVEVCTAAKIVVEATGGGGGGGTGSGALVFTTPYIGTGGGGGGSGLRVQKVFHVQKGDKLVIKIGQGGAAGTITGPSRDGQAGNPTSVTLCSHRSWQIGETKKRITAEGGQGGLAGLDTVGGNGGAGNDGGGGGGATFGVTPGLGGVGLEYSGQSGHASLQLAFGGMGGNNHAITEGGYTFGGQPSLNTPAGGGGNGGGVTGGLGGGVSFPFNNIQRSRSAGTQGTLGGGGGGGVGGTADQFNIINSDPPSDGGAGGNGVVRIKVEASQLGWGNSCFLFD